MVIALWLSHLSRIGHILVRHKLISGISKVSFILLASRLFSEMISLSHSTFPTISITRCRVGPRNAISMQGFLGALKKPWQTSASVDQEQFESCTTG